MAYSNYSDQADINIINYCKSLKVGDKIKFISEKQRYTIQGKTDRYIVCTKPFNARKTYLYSVIDLERYVRGRVSLIFGLINDVNTPNKAAECLKDLESGEYEVSHRHCIKLDVELPVI